MKEQVLTICRRINKEIPDGDEIRLIDDGYIDSFGVFTIMAELELVYNLVLDETDMVYANFKDVKSIVELIRKKQRG